MWHRCPFGQWTVGRPSEPAGTQSDKLNFPHNVWQRLSVLNTAKFSLLAGSIHFPKGNLLGCILRKQCKSSHQLSSSGETVSGTKNSILEADARSRCRRSHGCLERQAAASRSLSTLTKMNTSISVVSHTAVCNVATADRHYLLVSLINPEHYGSLTGCCDTKSRISFQITEKLRQV